MTPISKGFHTSLEHITLEKFANADLAQWGFDENLGRHLLPLFLSAKELFSLARANKAWEKLLSKHFTVLESWKGHSFLKNQIELADQKTRDFQIVESLFIETFQKSKPMAQKLGYVQGLNAITLEAFPNFIEDLNLVTFCDALLNQNKPVKEDGEVLDGYATRLRNWIKNTPPFSQRDYINLRDRGLTVLPKEIGFFTRLRELTLEKNQLTSLPDSIGNLRVLRNLNLKNNKLNALPESIGNFRHLITLDLQNNRLKVLPNSIETLEELIVLHLRRNQLRSLPNNIGSLRSLCGLYLENNQLSALPDTISKLTSLAGIDLRGNAFTTFPDCFSRSIVKINLSHNQLRSLPESVEKLTELRWLYLQNNQLRSLPKTIRKLRKLRTFLVDHNPLRNLPETIENLEYLDFQSWDKICIVKTKQQLLHSQEFKERFGVH